MKSNGIAVDDADDWRVLISLPGRRDDAFDAWLRRSPRRALAPSRKRVVLARRRPWPGPGGYVTNAQPAPGARPDQVVWSIDIFDGANWGRVVLPPGVAVESLALPENDRLQVRFVFDDMAAGTLGLGATRALDASLSPVWARLGDLPEPPRAQNALRTLAKILRDAGVAAGDVAALGDEQAAADRRADEERRRAAERRHAAIWKAHARRGRRDLGPLAKRLDVAMAADLGADAGPAFAGDLARLARVCVAAVATGPAATAPVGASRMGGLPDLPEGTRWPATRGALLSFILQIDLAAVPAGARGGLPSGGLLSLFMGENESTTTVEHRVVLSPRRGLRRCALPRDARFRDDDTGLLEPIALALEPALSLPDYGSDELAALGARHDFLSGDAIDRYMGMVRALVPKQMVASMFGHPSSDEAAGNAARSPAAKRVRARNARDPDSWVNLLCVRSHAPAGLTFWDAGELDVMVPRAALARRSFDLSYAEISTG